MVPRGARALSLSTPARAIVIAFALAIGVGTTLLALPVSQATNSNVTLLDALFTATSAICVTGLSVVDIGTAFSRFGQGVIMLLVKCGGIGILSLGALLALATGRRIGVRERVILQEQTGRPHVGGVVRFVRDLLVYTTVVELLGAALLLPRFVEQQGFGLGAFYALFHSVSAFNNAGFGLYRDNLMSFVTDPVVIPVIAGLLILGGLGMAVVAEVVDHVRGRPVRRWSLHTRIALLTTAVLIVFGTLFVLVVEWSNTATLGPLGPAGKVLGAFFQAVTPRTAGFNSLDYGAMREGSLLVTMFLMFVGGSPSSTAGGVKTTTLAVLMLTIWSVVRGHGRPVAFGRLIDAQLITKAAAVTSAAALTVLIAATALTFTDPEVPGLRLLFETFSALGTVGLSTGITPELSSGARIILCLLMFAGRVGLVTFAVALASSGGKERLRYPREELIIG